MAQFRYDPLNDTWVISAPERASRPHMSGHPTGEQIQCPFCPGNEDSTPPTTFQIPEPGPWRVRAFDNKYPIMLPTADEPTESELFPTFLATGFHENVVMSPDHNKSLGVLTDTEVIDFFQVLRHRASSHIERGALHTQILVNHGREAGASISHPHAQVISSSHAPPVITTQIRQCEKSSRNWVLDQLHTELEVGSRIVARQDRTVIWCPYSSSLPYAMAVAHTGAGPRFDLENSGAVASVAIATRDAVSWLDQLENSPPYNVLIHSAYRDARGPFSWHLTIEPRTQTIAGYELGAGVFVNTVLPEDAAAKLADIASH